MNGLRKTNIKNDRKNTKKKTRIKSKNKRKNTMKTIKIKLKNDRDSFIKTIKQYYLKNINLI